MNGHTDTPPERTDADFTIGVGADVELPHLTLPADFAGDDQQAEQPPAQAPQPEGGESTSPPSGDSAPIAIPDWAVQAATVAVFEYVANKRGPHWQLSEAEAEAIAIPLAAELTELVEALGLAVPGNAIPFLTARRLEIVAALAAAIVPRYMQDREYARLAHVVANDDAEVLHPRDPGTSRPAPPVNGYDPNAPVSMAEALKSKQQNGATE